MMQRPRRRATRARLVGLVALVALVVAMVANTKFLTPAELAASGPTRFDPPATAADLFGRAQDELPDRAQPLAEVIAGVQDDPKAAAEKFEATVPAENSYVYAVTTTATVTEATAASLRLQVPGVDRTPVQVPLTTAVNGTVLRDAMGFKFADAPGQTEYQYVGDELKKLMQDEIRSSVSDPASLEGKKVTVLGVVSVLTQGGAPAPRARPVSVQPISIEAGS